MYTSDQLEFVGATVWKNLIETYYDLVYSPVPTDTTKGPVGKLLTPDVTPPTTTVGFSGTITVGQAITATWVVTDTESKPSNTVLWYQPPQGQWAPVLTLTASSGTFSFTWPERCESGLAVRSTDNAGNEEPWRPDNVLMARVAVCERLYLPWVLNGY